MDIHAGVYDLKENEAEKLLRFDRVPALMIVVVVRHPDVDDTRALSTLLQSNVLERASSGSIYKRHG